MTLIIKKLFIKYWRKLTIALVIVVAFALVFFKSTDKRSFIDTAIIFIPNDGVQEAARLLSYEKAQPEAADWLRGVINEENTSFMERVIPYQITSIDSAQHDIFNGPGEITGSEGIYRLKNRESGDAALGFRKRNNLQGGFRNAVIECDVVINEFYHHESNGVALGVRGDSKFDKGYSFEYLPKRGIMKMNPFHRGDGRYGSNAELKTSREPGVKFHLLFMVGEKQAYMAVYNYDNGNRYDLQGEIVPDDDFPLLAEGIVYLHTWKTDATFSNIKIAELH